MAGGVAAYRIDQVHQYFPQKRDAVRIDRPRPVEDWTAQQLGVHPAIHGVTTPDADDAFVLPDYLERDHDRQLRQRLTAAACGEQATLVLLRGESCTGKTRTAFEAVRACLTGWQLIFPKNAKRLSNLLDVGASPRAPCCG